MRNLVIVGRNKRGWFVSLQGVPADCWLRVDLPLDAELPLDDVLAEVRRSYPGNTVIPSFQLVAQGAY